MLSIRMRRTGSKKRPFYRVVVTEARTPREGSFLEVLGSYNPRTKPATVEIDRDRVNHWIRQGARPSDSVRTLLARHLTRDRGAVPPIASEPVAPGPASPETPAESVASAPTTPTSSEPPAAPADEQVPAPS